MSLSVASTIDSPAIRIEALTTHQQFDDCAAVQDAVWGYEPAARMTQKVFLLASTIGGQVIGAYVDGDDGATLVGYAMSLPGVRGGQAYLHSHHLAVLPEWRNHRIGQQLKLAQRNDALRRGIELMEWTFDPLELKNAHLNFAKLGVISRRYRHDFYGPSSSPLQGGLPTDRLVAEWWLRSERVRRVLAGEAAVLNVSGRVDVPAEISMWKADPTTRALAREVQSRNAEALEVAFARGLAIVGYQRNERGDGHFLLGSWNEEFALE